MYTLCYSCCAMNSFSVFQPSFANTDYKKKGVEGTGSLLSLSVVLILSHTEGLLPASSLRCRRGNLKCAS